VSTEPETSEPVVEPVVESMTEPAPEPATAVPATTEPAEAAASEPGAAGDEPVGDESVVPDDPGAPSERGPLPFIQVEVVNVAFNLPSPSPVIQLRELELPYRVVHFPIGLAEAQAIALALEHEASPRPTTSELLAAVVSTSGSDVVAVRLTGTMEGTMLAELDLMTPRGHVVLDCRPSDGIALALRQTGPAPILCEPSMLDA
jgi:bifunctional DNase/RNase